MGGHACASPAACAAWHGRGQSHGQGQATGGNLRATCPVCLHAPPVQVCARIVTEKKVKANRARPPPGDSGAPLRTMVTKQTTLHTACESFPHEAQVFQRRCFRRMPASSLAFHTHSSSTHAWLVRLALAQCRPTSWSTPSPRSRASVRSAFDRYSSTPSALWCWCARLPCEEV